MYPLTSTSWIRYKTGRHDTVQNRTKPYSTTKAGLSWSSLDLEPIMSGFKDQNIAIPDFKDISQQ
jgi:hypothetical protein